MMVRVLRTIGFDVGFRKGQGQYLSIAPATGIWTS